jgi:hypothetical protein
MRPCSLEAMHQTSARPSTCALTAVLIFALGFVVSSARLISDAPVSQINSVDDVSRRSDQRFAELKGLLPEHGVVGYIGDSTDPIADYYLTQYALAPLVVEHSLKHPLIVGNFPSSPARVAEYNLRIIRDFGNGVLLLAPEGDK